MNRIIYILLCLCVLVQACGNTIICLHYQANKTEITARYCVNKNQPEKQCAGSCRLHKNLQEAEKNHFPVKVKENINAVLFCQAFLGFIFPTYLTLPVYGLGRHLLKLSRPGNKVFQPPQSARGL